MRRLDDICSCLLHRATIAIEVHHMKTRKAHLLLAVVAGVLFVGLFAASVARACGPDSGLVLFDGEMPGGG
jgi:hypothetical protein